MIRKLLTLIKNKFLTILFWSIISAAFIGPGTVTTCTQAGAYYHYDLMWAMLFSTIGCIFLQEATARITILSGKNLGEALTVFFASRGKKTMLFILIVGAIIVGCAAYETGNILGAVEGLLLIFPKLESKISNLIPEFYTNLEHFKETNPFFSELKISKIIFVFIIGILVFLAFKFKSMKTIANAMGVLVFLMGIAFISTFVAMGPSVKEFFHGSLIPRIPEGFDVLGIPSPGILILAIIGTTIVPYDLFLGSSLADKKQSLFDMRFGITISIALGGFVSMAIIAVGSEITAGWDKEAITGMVFNFKLVSNILELTIGDWAVYIFGFGLFAAGFTSAITSPLASALTASSIFKQKKPELWSLQSKNFKRIIYFVLSVGLTFGFLNIKPIPVIITAQALNGLILPFISIFLLFVINERKIMGKIGVNGIISNLFMTFTVWITLVIGIISIVKAGLSAFKITTPISNSIIISIILSTFVISISILFFIYRRRRRNNIEEEQV